jgi:signal transduction histidine kinase
MRVIRWFGVHSYLMVPLLAHGRALGVLTFGAARQRGPFDEIDLELAKELGRRAGVAVDHSRLYREAREAVRSREQVLAVVSHDLRNPLWTIRMCVSVLERTASGLDPDARKQLEVLLRSTGRMERRIRDLLDMANIEAGRLSVSLAPVDADALVAEAAEQHAPLVSEARRDLVVRAAAGGARVSCDRERILQVFENLVGNALKFTPQGGRITVGCERVADGVRFVVSDDGPGIAPDDLPHLFQPYWKGRSSAGKGGTGLGLYICKGIVGAHGGSIEVRSTEGAGTTFSFRLPFAS